MTTDDEAPDACVRQLPGLPGPSGWPLLGNALEVEPPTVHLAEQ
jgi:hypothetical protein